MEAYPPEYVQHNRPLILLSGLGSDSKNAPASPDQSGTYLHEGGFRIQSNVPGVTGTTADSLIQVFDDLNADESAWSPQNGGGKGVAGIFQIRRIGRTYTLPPRKAPPPPQSPFSAPLGNGSSPPVPLTLHSTISPLTPSSPIFPDGIMTPLWITKHQTRLPSAFIAFFPLTSDPTTSSLSDNQLKNEINNVRSVFASTNYKTKFVAIFLCEDGQEIPYDIEDRMVLIRRTTGLDAKTSFFIAPDALPAQVDDFVKTVLLTLQPTCIEYYRDLSKHARRKRNRGSPPPPTAPPTSGTAQTLSQQGWNVRYEFKLGVLAEFRQEMDAACRNFETAYEGLFAPDLIETIPSWSPRFNEARMLADVIAIRIIRCLLLTGQTTTAARSWDNHRDRIRDLVTRRGKGTDTYGWEAWEALWSKTMAQLVDRAGLTGLSTSEQIDPQIRKAGGIYCLPEKTIPIGERISPWEHLHHQGYWLNISQKHTQKRRSLAILMPEEDRSRPGESPASVIASKAHLYDTYLAPEPFEEYPVNGGKGFDHTKEIVDTIRSSIGHFSARRQFRTVEIMYLEMAKVLMTAERWNDALRILESIWSSLSWRKSGWGMLINEVGWAMYDCAIKCNDHENVLRALWELYSSHFPPRPEFKYDLQQSLEGLEAISPKAAVVVKTEESSSPITCTFAFLASNGNVGEGLDAQLVIKSTAQPDSAPIHLSEVKIGFEGGLKSIRLLSDDTEDGNSEGSVFLMKLQLQDSAHSADLGGLQSPTSGLGSLVGHANLTLAPGVTKAFDLSTIPREPGEVKVASITTIIDEEKFSLTSITGGNNTVSSEHWYTKDNRVISRKLGQDQDVITAKIFPKPPKLEIGAQGLRQTYYTNEEVQLEFDLENKEDDDAEVTIEVHIYSPAETELTAIWHDTADEVAKFSGVVDETSIATLSLPPRHLGIFKHHTSQSLKVILSNTDAPVQYEVTVSAKYHLVSEAETPMSKELAISVPFIRPFEANYDFTPRLDPKPWPNFFEMADDETLAKNRVDSNTNALVPEGLSQRFILTSKVASFATESLIIEDVALVVEGITGGALCQITQEPTESSPSTSAGIDEKVIAPSELQDSIFNILITKYALADRRQVGLDFALAIRWRRIDATDEGNGIVSTVSTLATPQFAIPMAEPRILLAKSLPEGTVDDSSLKPAGLVILHYILENPSLHFLTFSLTMESSEDFAFSGPKTMTLSLVPLSRHSVAFRILANKKDINSKEKNGMWLRPNLLVVDQGFRKTLRVIAAGEGVKQDKKGVMVWVD